MTDKRRHILSVLQEHPLEWMTSTEIAKHKKCKQWATTASVSEILSTSDLGNLPGIEYRPANIRYRNSTKQYRWNPEGA